ncbi:MAG: Hpt domain-containing protein [Pirellulaceae bacterium]|nr:Hpt domain-containing protein [Pirellulaceae bacterium]
MTYSDHGEPLLDWSVAQETVQGDVALLRQVVTSITNEVPLLLEAIQKAVVARDAKSLQISAHTLKSSLRYLGALKQANFASDLETMGRDACLDKAPQVVAKLLPLTQATLMELQRFLAAEDR